MEGFKITKGLWSDINDVIDDYKRRRELGTGGRPKRTPRNYDRVKVKNTTASDIRAGEVLEFTDFALSEVNPEYLWFEGYTPDLTNVGWGISLKPVIAGEIGEFLVTGVCLAIVQFPNADLEETHAELRDGQGVLWASIGGPAKILYVGDETGEAEWEHLCVVQIMDESDVVDIVEVVHDGPSNGDIVEANSDGYHPGKIRRKNGTSYTDAGDCWIQFVNGFAGYPANAGNVPAYQGNYYGPARLTGRFDLVGVDEEEEETHDDRPVYVCECSEAAFLCVFDAGISAGSTGTVSLYNRHDQSDSGVNLTSVLAWGTECESGKKGMVQRTAGGWTAAQMEWEC